MISAERGNNFFDMNWFWRRLPIKAWKLEML